MDIVKFFKKNKIKIRSLDKNDLRDVQKFQKFINSLIKEGAQILYDRKFSLQEEKEWLRGELSKIRKNKAVYLVAEDDNRIIGTAGISLRTGRQIHVGEFGITIKKAYRGMGLGSYLITEIMKSAKKVLKPRPRFFRISVFSTNKPAIGLYKKQGFKKVAQVTKQVRYGGKLVDEIIMVYEL